MKEYIAGLLSELSYPRKVEIEFEWDKPWEVSTLKDTTITSDGQEVDNNIAITYGRGTWMLYIDGKWMDYELNIEWNVPKEYLSVSLTKPKLERLLKGEFVPNVPGHVPHYLDAPEKDKMDNSVIDKMKKTVEMFLIKNDEAQYIINDMPIDEDEIKFDITKPLFPSEYNELEVQMKEAILSLGWKWNEIDKDKMDRCIRDTLDEDGKFETCLKKYLKKG